LEVKFNFQKMSLSIHHISFEEVLGLHSEEDSKHIEKAKKLAQEAGFKESSQIEKIVKIYNEGRKNDASTVTFVPDVSSIRKISVPDFQREYVWGLKKNNEIGDFLNDISEVYNHIVDNSNSKTSPDDLLAKETGLFFGNIIFLIKESEKKFEIIDGQQRFTTIYLFLAAYRTWLQYRKTDENLKDQDKQKLEELIRFCNRCFYIHESIFFECSITIKSIFNAYIDRDWFNNLNPNMQFSDISSEEFENEIVLNILPDIFNVKTYDDNKKSTQKTQMHKKWEDLEIPKDEAQLISKIFTSFLVGINNLLSSIDHCSLIADIFKKIKFSRVIVDSEEEAYVFFERTNSRGATLEIHDLVKAYVFGNTSSKNHEKQKERWNKIIRNKADKTTNIQLVKYFWNSRGGGAQSTTVFKKLKQMYSPSHYEKELNIAKMVDDLEHFSNFYYLLTAKRFIRAHLIDFLVKLNEKFGYSDSENKLIGKSTTSANFNRIASSLNALSTFDQKIHIPLSYSILVSFFKHGLQKDSDKIKKLIEFFSNIENIHFRLRAIGKKPQFFESPYHKSAASFYNPILLEVELEKDKKIYLDKKC